MKKALIVTSVASMVDQFLLPNIFLLQDMGYMVQVACNFESGSTCSKEKIEKLKKTLDDHNVKKYHIEFARDVMKISQNIRAYNQIKRIISENHYELVHCHSPIGGLICRLACRRARKLGTKVFYTAHGFHFYKGAPIKNWLLYYPVEKLCARWTDVLITINKEDYALAKKKMKTKRTEYIPGVGIDLKKFGHVVVDRAAKRRELGVPESAILLLSVGELNKNKNHEIVIRAIADLNVYYVIAGKGNLEEHLQKTINELKMIDRVKLIGFRDDMEELYKISDAFVFPSFREGLSVSIMEAMASGLPVVCSRIRGNIDLIDGNGGIIFDPHDIKSCRNAIKQLINQDLESIGKHNSIKIGKFDVGIVNRNIKKIYES